MVLVDTITAVRTPHERYKAYCRDDMLTAAESRLSVRQHKIGNLKEKDDFS